MEGEGVLSFRGPEGRSGMEQEAGISSIDAAAAAGQRQRSDVDCVPPEQEGASPGRSIKNDAIVLLNVPRVRCLSS